MRRQKTKDIRHNWTDHIRRAKDLRYGLCKINIKIQTESDIEEL
jgi:hypothetical protein